MRIPQNINKQPQEDGEFNEIVLDIKAEKKQKQKQREQGKINNALDLFRYINDWLIDQSKIKLEDKLIFFRLLGACVNAGVSIPEALMMIKDQTKNQKLQRVIQNLFDLIEDGENLANAMRRNSDIFDEISSSIIAAGEKSGKLSAVISELVQQYERIDRIQKKVKSVMTYPIIVISIIILLTAVVLIFIVPKLIEIFGSIENLPLPTRILQGMSNFVIHKWEILLILIVVVLSSFMYWKKSRIGKRQWANFILHTPVISPIIKGMVISRITRVFGFLITSGVPIIDGLKITAATANNPLYEEKLLLASDDLTKGITIAENISDNEKMFPKMLVNMVSVGEKTASLEVIMSKIADFYEEEIDRKIGTLSKAIEPIILIFIALAAVFFIMAIYLPILKINDAIIG